MKRLLAAQFAPVLRAWRNGYEAEVRRAAIAFFPLVFLAFGVCLAVPELRLGFSAYLQHLFQGMDLTDGAGNLSPLLLLANNLRACAVTMLYGLIPFVRLPALALGVNAVLLGGRYAGLCGKFGDPMPAVGFSIDLDAVAELNPALAGPAPVEALVYGEPGFEMQGQKLVSSLAGQGVLCESSLFETEAETLEYAKKRNIPTVYVVGENTREITLEGGKR